MLIKPLIAGKSQIKNNVFLAPMAGYTDGGFRSLILELGAGLTFTELVSSKGIVYRAKGNDILLSGSDKKYTSAQIFGSEPYFMRKAIESDYLKDFNLIDINMGCPVPKLFNNGDGSALLQDLKKIEQIVSECVKTGKDISVKIRTGIKHGDDIASQVAMAVENAGGIMVTIHGRAREDYYSGEPNFDAIYKAKKSVKIPVIANGGIYTKQDAINMLDKTGADGIMIGRGGISNPFLFSELLGTKPNYTLKTFILEDIKRKRELYGDKRASLEFRKFVPYYFKGLKDFKEVKMSLMTCQCTQEIEDIINQNL